MNANDGSTAKDFDPDTAPDLSRDGWPEKFAAATISRGQPSVTKPKVSTAIRIQRDSRGQPYIEWEQAKGIYKRAWVQHRTGDKDWAGSTRYLNVVRCEPAGHPKGNATDFPIYNDLPDEQVLLSLVYAVNAITGCAANV